LNLSINRSLLHTESKLKDAADVVVRRWDVFIAIVVVSLRRR